MKDLWVDIYRPKKVDDYIFIDKEHKRRVVEWITVDKTTPHLLLSGPSGTGKTSLALMMLSELGVLDCDILKINASAKNGVEYVRDTILNFSSRMPVGEYKYIILDEADHLSTQAQAALRGVIEENSDTTRFIMTCNYPHKIIPALHSRFQAIHIDKLDKDDFIIKIVNVLIDQKIEIDVDILNKIVDDTYPDMRKCINTCQYNTIDGILTYNKSTTTSSSGGMEVAIDMFKAGKYREGREFICKNISYEQYEDFYRFMYDNTGLWDGNDEDKTRKVIIAIRDGLVKDTSVADREINLSATLVTLELIVKGIL